MCNEVKFLCRGVTAAMSWPMVRVDALLAGMLVRAAWEWAAYSVAGEEVSEDSSDAEDEVEEMWIVRNLF